MSTLTNNFCYNFNNVIIEHVNWPTLIKLNYKNKDISQLLSRNYKINNKTINIENSINMFNDELLYSNANITEPCMLFYEEFSTNYFHYLTDCFPKLQYYLFLIKTIPNLKLLITEEYINNLFIKDSLKMTLNSLNNVIILKKDIKYHCNQIIIPNEFYYWPENNIPDIVINSIESLATSINQQCIYKGVYVSRQDTQKKGWWHNRNVQNELILIDKIKTELKYDIVELMDLSLEDKIKIFKSYKNIIQQNGASTVNLFFCNPKTNFHIISHPFISKWANPLLKNISDRKNVNFYEYNYGMLIGDQCSGDINNQSWSINNIDDLITNLIKNEQN
jgi:hypothetical protein